MAEYLKRASTEVRYTDAGESYGPESVAELQNLRHVFAVLGAPTEQYKGDPSVYDEALQEAVVALQEKKLLRSTGVFAENTAKALNQEIDAFNIRLAAKETGTELNFKEIPLLSENENFRDEGAKKTLEQAVKNVVTHELGYKSLKEFASKRGISFGESESAADAGFISDVNRAIMETNHDRLLGAAARVGIKPGELQQETQNTGKVSSFLNSTVEIDPQQVAQRVDDLTSQLDLRLQEQLRRAREGLDHQAPTGGRGQRGPDVPTPA